MKKFMFVGLGGSGGKTLRFLRIELRKWLDQIGWEGPTRDSLPIGWELIQIDTPSSQDGAEITNVPMLPPSSYQGLVGTGISFQDVSTTLVAAGRTAGGWEDLVSWRVNPVQLRVPIDMGAGQYRAVGRTIGLAYASQIFATLKAAANRLNSAEAAAQLAEISRLATGTERSTDANPVAVVVSSLAGGSGAGLLMDVCDLLRQVGGNWGDNSFGILYTSDVFSQSGEREPGLQANTLAALSEVLNGHWLTPEGYGDAGRITPILAAAGAAIPVARSGPAFPFLVGASNSKGINFGSQATLYQMMGRALRSWVSDVSVQDKLIAYTITNWHNVAAMNPLTADVLFQQHEGVFQAYGFSEVNLGLDRFEVYATERLARMTADWLHSAHIAIAKQQDPNDARPAEQMVDDFAKQCLISFLRDSRIDEAGPDNNDVINAIRPVDYSVQFDVKDLALASACLAEVNERGMKSEPWIQHIDTFLPAFAGEFASEQLVNMNELARTWVSEQPEVTFAAIKQVISRFGLLVSARVVELAIQQSDVTFTELHEEAAELDGLAGSYSGYMGAILNSNGRYKPTHEDVAQAIREGLWYLGNHRVEAQRRRVAAGILRSYSENFLKPLARALSDAHANLDIKGYVGNGSDLPSVIEWSIDEPRSSLLPPKNERMVIPAETFEVQVDKLAMAHIGDDSMDDVKFELRCELIEGEFISKTTEARASAKPPIVMNQTWIIDPTLVGEMKGVPTPATFTTAFNPDDLLERSRAWLYHSTAFKLYLSQDLRTYLDESPGVDPKELNKRQQDFMIALQSAVESAEPLVSVDRRLESLLYGKEGERRARPGILPFKGHPMESRVKEKLSELISDTTFNVDDLLKSDPHVTTIPISSTLPFPHDPLVFSSISRPIISSWAASVGTPAAASFWKFRRARPLSEFVPVSPALLQAMVRGWFTALALGRIDRKGLRIQRANGDIASFPQALLSEVDRGGRDLLPAVLESLGLAYIEVAQLGNTTPLDAYSELRDLGTSAKNLGSGMSPEFRYTLDYVDLNPELSKWISNGDLTVAGRDPIGDAYYSGEKARAAADPAARRAFALTDVEEVIGEYEVAFRDYVESVGRNPDNLGANNLLWVGLYGESGPIPSALADLKAAFESVPTSQGTR
jgi:hypothetical protein